MELAAISVRPVRSARFRASVDDRSIDEISKSQKHAWLSSARISQRSSSASPLEVGKRFVECGPLLRPQPEIAECPPAAPLNGDPLPFNVRSRRQ